MREISRILFIRTDRIGDVLMNLPAIRLLRQTFPKAWITLLLDKSVADLLKNHPDLDEVLEVDAAGLKKDWKARRQLTGKVKHARFDLAVVSNPDKFLHSLTFFARIPRRIGYDRKWGFFLNKKMADCKDNAARHEIDLNLELVSLASDKAWDGELRLPIDEKAAGRMKDLLERNWPKDAEIIAIHPGTSNPQKRWPMERFVELGKMIVGAYCIAVIGGEEEKGLGEYLAKEIGGVDFTGQLSLKELTALLGRCQALVSSDSGPVHVAWMSGTPVVALYAKNVPGSNPARWGPRDGKSEVIYKPLSEIRTEEVYGALKKILDRKARARVALRRENS